jgi:hypothetical protein
MTVRPRFGNLPLFAKLLVPYLALMVFVGVFGVVLIVRDLGSRAQASLDQQLAQRSLDARSVLRDRELYLLESANFAANVEGVAQAVQRHDEATAARALQSVVALKHNLNLVAVTDRDGSTVAQFVRAEPGAPPVRTSEASFGALVPRALRGPIANKSAGFFTVGPRHMFGMVAHVCAGIDPCTSVGGAVVGVDVSEVHGCRRVRRRPEPPVARRNDAGHATVNRCENRRDR